MTTQSGERDSLSHLPGYIVERRRHAEQAGLILDRQVRRQGLLSTWYSGSEAGFRATRWVRIPEGFDFPSKVGGRKLYSLRVFCPAAPDAELKCSVAKTAEDRYRLAIVNEPMPVAWRSLGSRIDIYKYSELNDGANRGPATVYVGPFAPLAAAGIAPPEAERDSQSDTSEHRTVLWHSQPLAGGRYRFVVYDEAAARTRAQDEERGRSDFRNPEQYQDWLLEVIAASIGMIRRQLRVKTRRRHVYTLSARTLKELEAHFSRLRQAIVRSEIIVEKDDARARPGRAAERRAAAAAMGDADFQRFLVQALSAPPKG